jgi:hypothetical protein
MAEENARSTVKVSGLCTIESVNAPGQFLNVAERNQNNGANVQLWNNPECLESQWVVEPQDPGWVAVRNVLTGGSCRLDVGVFAL